MSFTVYDIAAMLAGRLDGEYDDGLPAFLAAVTVGVPLPTEAAVDLDIADDSDVAGVGDVKRFRITVTEVE